MTPEILKKAIRNVPDFPKKGIQFKDITTLLKQPDLLRYVIDNTTKYYEDKGITKIVAIESRGFITGGALAEKLGAGFVPVRKPGRLPAEVFKKSYALEYGENCIEIHRDALVPEDIVLLHDDLLATGGTALAAIDLISRFNVQQVYCCFIIELDFLKGREKIMPLYDVFSLVHF
ncbi:MAG: adenine phosphoribosyltransferase [Bacteroidales bacterium]|nr:adenine phosphoribosyltransferase [Bacteroidales bacterium]MBN2763465.1 adenine phosphoribosyltransferase [Bacteroidales bacterium]